MCHLLLGLTILCASRSKHKGDSIRPYFRTLTLHQEQPQEDLCDQVEPLLYHQVQHLRHYAAPARDGRLAQRAKCQMSRVRG